MPGALWIPDAQGRPALAVPPSSPRGLTTEDCEGSGCCGTVDCPSPEGFLKFTKCECNRAGSSTPCWYIAAALFRELTAPLQRKCLTFYHPAEPGGPVCMTVTTDSARVSEPPSGGGCRVYRQRSDLPGTGWTGTCCGCCSKAAINQCSLGGTSIYRACCAKPPGDPNPCAIRCAPGVMDPEGFCCSRRNLRFSGYAALFEWNRSTTGGDCTFLQEHPRYEYRFNLAGRYPVGIGSDYTGSAMYRDIRLGPSGQGPPACGFVLLGYTTRSGTGRCTPGCEGYCSNISIPGASFNFAVEYPIGLKATSGTTFDPPTQTTTTWREVSYGYAGVFSEFAFWSRRTTVLFGGSPFVEQHSYQVRTFSVERIPTDIRCKDRCLTCEEAADPTGPAGSAGEPTPGAGTLIFDFGAKGISVRRRGVVRAGAAPVMGAGAAVDVGGGGCAGCGSSELVLPTRDELERVTRSRGTRR